MTEETKIKVLANEADLNLDPISGETGAHPLGTGAGAASAGMAGAVLGTVVGGPIGGLIGAAVGAVAGGLAGTAVAEVIDPTAEEYYWRQTYLREPYYVQGRAFEYYAPGFRAGWEGRVRHNGRTFEQAEHELMNDYVLAKGELDPGWSEVRPAARAAWNRVDGRWHAKA